MAQAHPSTGSGGDRAGSVMSSISRHQLHACDGKLHIRITPPRPRTRSAAPLPVSSSVTDEEQSQAALKARIASLERDLSEIRSLMHHRQAPLSPSPLQAQSLPLSLAELDGSGSGGGGGSGSGGSGGDKYAALIAEWDALATTLSTTATAASTRSHSVRDLSLADSVGQQHSPTQPPPTPAPASISAQTAEMPQPGAGSQRPVTPARSAEQASDSHVRFQQPPSQQSSTPQRASLSPSSPVSYMLSSPSKPFVADADSVARTALDAAFEALQRDYTQRLGQEFAHARDIANHHPSLSLSSSQPQSHHSQQPTQSTQYQDQRSSSPHRSRPQSTESYQNSLSQLYQEHEQLKQQTLQQVEQHCQQQQREHLEQLQHQLASERQQWIETQRAQHRQCLDRTLADIRAQYESLDSGLKKKFLSKLAKESQSAVGVLAADLQRDSVVRQMADQILRLSEALKQANEHIKRLTSSDGASASASFNATSNRT